MADNKTTKIQCVRCRRETNHSIEKEYEFTEVETYRNPIYPKGVMEQEYEISAKILKCMGCDEISFKYVAWTDWMEDEPYEKIYPIRDLDSRIIKTHPQMKPIINTIYRQTIDAFNGNLNYLCGVGLRTIVEAICIEKKIKDGPLMDAKGVGLTDKQGIKVRSNKLEGKINGLYEKGILTLEATRTLHAHRYLGNEAVHDLKEPTKEELGAAIDIIEHILEALFVITKKVTNTRGKLGSHIRKKTP